MQIQRLMAGSALALAAAFASAPASAGVTLITTQAAFSSLGAITQNTNWDDSQGTPDWWFPEWQYVGKTVTVGDLTIVSNIHGNIILTPRVGSETNVARTLFSDQNYLPVTFQIAGSHDLFAFNFGMIHGEGEADIVVTTNLGSYSFTPFVRNVRNLGPLTFLGFQADAGEVFQSVSFQNEYPRYAGVTDVQLGTAAVPEPASWALMLTGFLGAGGALRSLRRRQAALPA